MKKLVIAICLLLIAGSGAYAQDVEGAKMPGGKFTLGEFDADDSHVYRNAWAGLSFTAQDYYEDMSYIAMADVVLIFAMEDAQIAARAAQKDFGRATAFMYSADGKGSVCLFVFNLGRDIIKKRGWPAMGIVKDHNEFLEQLVNHYQSDNYEGRAKVKEPYPAVLGGRDFVACEITIRGGLIRYYVQTLDDLMIMVEMQVHKEIDRGWLLKEFESCFEQYK